MNELNPCPFCGKIPNAEYIEDVMYVICSNNSCGMSCIASVTLKEWNNRPIEDALRAHIDELKSENKALRLIAGSHSMSELRRNRIMVGIEQFIEKYREVSGRK